MTDNGDAIQRNPATERKTVTGHDGLYSVRLAKLADACAILSLQKKSMLLYSASSGIPEGRLEALDESITGVSTAIQKGYVLVAVDLSGEIKGSVRVLPRDLREFTAACPDTELSGTNGDGIVGYFSRFAVMPDLHNVGIGGLLYTAAEQTARERNLSFLFLHTATGNTELVSFYERRGFRRIGVDAKRGYDRGLFVKKL